MSDLAAYDLLCTFVVDDDGTTWGERALPEQHKDARESIAGEQPYQYLTRARGWSKSEDMAGIMLAELVLAPGDSELQWLANDADQGRLCLQSVRGFVNRTPALAGRIDVQRDHVLDTKTQSRIKVLAADAAGSWGARPWRIVIDEIAQSPVTPAHEQLLDAVMTAATKVEGCRMRLITTAGSFAHPSFKLLEHAKSNDLWRVHEIAGPAPWQDPKRIAEQRSRLPDAIAAQLLDNRWSEASGAFLSADDLAACFALEGPTLERDPAYSYFAGVDLGLKNDATAVAIGHREDEVVKLDRLMVWKGSRIRPVDMLEVESAILEAHKTYRPKILCDPWQSEGMVQRLKRQGVKAEMYNFSATSKMHLAQGLLTAVGDHVLKLYDAPGLRDELSRLKLKQSSTGLWTFDHGSGRGDHDDMAMAISLMLQASLTRGNRRPFSVSWSPYNDVQGPASFEEALAEAIERRDDERRVHGAEGHRQWAQRNFCQECYDAAPEREHERALDAAIAAAKTRPRKPYVKDLGYFG